MLEKKVPRTQKLVLICKVSFVKLMTFALELFQFISL